jgi:hypothetical protein
MRLLSAIVVSAALALPSAALAAERPHRENPYAGLFTGQLSSGQAPSVPKPPAPSLPFVQLPNLVQPTTPEFPLPAVIIKCGMTIYRGDASIDPKILTPRTPTPTNKTFRAPACVK